MQRIKYSKDAREKELGLKASVALGDSADWRTLVVCVLLPCHASFMRQLAQIDPGNPELPRLQGAAQVLEDLMTISDDAKLVLRGR